jgi:hypothetical protein
MNELSLPRTRTSNPPKHDSGFALRLALVAPLLFTAQIVGLLFPIEDAPSKRYDGHFGGSVSGKYYDDLTKAEHDAMGAWWGR